MSNIELVPSCDPVTALRRIALQSRTCLLSRIHQELQSAHSLGPDTREKILAGLRAVQQHARARQVADWQVDHILQVVRSHPAGRAYAHGGHGKSGYMHPPKTTYLHLAWITLRGQTLCRWECSRDLSTAEGTPASMARHFLGLGFDISDPGRPHPAQVHRAMSAVSPTLGAIASAVHAAAQALRTGVRLPQSIAELPADPITSDAAPWEAEVYPGLAIMILNDPSNARSVYLCTPLFACRSARAFFNRRTPHSFVATALEELGFRVKAEEVRRTGARVWKDALPTLASNAISLTLGRTQL
jgi:hypothetical protein